MCGEWVLFSTLFWLAVSRERPLDSSPGLSINVDTDTPWDEATTSSPEFCAYVDGTIFYEDPWNRFGDSALCKADFDEAPTPDAHLFWSHLQRYYEAFST